MASKKIFLIAGEVSGDLRGAELVGELRKIIPDLTCRGLGGPVMARAGVKILYDLTKEAVLGLGDVLRKYFHFHRIFHDALRAAERFKPDAVILIDYPGFNLRFAKKIARRFPVIYYISPQIWAWGGRRIRTIKKTVDHMIVFFDFERELYERAGVPVTWVGHPLVNVVKPSKSRAALRAEWLKDLSGSEKLIGFFPGSRQTEVKRILPEMLRAAEGISKRRPNAAYLVAEADSLAPELYQEIIRGASSSLNVKTVRHRMYDVLFAADFALVSSGTATLEAALASIPFAILYKTAWSTFFLARHLVQIPCIGLVNVVAGRKIVPEFIQHEIRSETIAQESAYLLDHADLREKMILDLKEVQQKLGEEGAQVRAAEVVAKFLGGKSGLDCPIVGS